MHKAKRALKNSLFQSFFICLSISAGVIVFLSLIFAIIANLLDDPTENLGLFSLAAMLLSAAVSGIVSTRIKGEGGVGFSSLVALTIVLVMLLINVIICVVKISLGAIMNYICYLGVAAMAAFLGRKKEGKRRHKN